MSSRATLVLTQNYGCPWHVTVVAARHMVFSSSATVSPSIGLVVFAPGTVLPGTPTVALAVLRLSLAVLYLFPVML